MPLKSPLAAQIASDIGLFLSQDQKTGIEPLESAQEDTQLRTCITNSVACIRDAQARFGRGLMLCFNGGKDCTLILVLILYVMHTDPVFSESDLTVFFIESPDNFPEVIDFVSGIAQTFQIDILRKKKGLRESIQDFLDEFTDIQAFYIGSRRTDPYCENLNVCMETDPGWPKCIRVHPILDWKYSQVWDFLRKFNVPYCPLYDHGYTSLGLKSNTVKNPLLKLECSSGAGSGEYLPAYHIKDCVSERLSRQDG